MQTTRVTRTLCILPLSRGVFSGTEIASSMPQRVIFQCLIMIWPNTSLSTQKRKQIVLSYTFQRTCFLCCFISDKDGFDFKIWPNKNYGLQLLRIFWYKFSLLHFYLSLKTSIWKERVITNGFFLAFSCILNAWWKKSKILYETICFKRYWLNHNILEV